MDIVHIAASGVDLPVIETYMLKNGSLLCLTGAAYCSTDDWINYCQIYADNWRLHQAFIPEMDYPMRQGSGKRSFPGRLHLLSSTRHTMASSTDPR
jgi:hypothetical protein